MSSENEKTIQRAALVLPIGVLKGGQASKLSTIYAAFLLILMELHLALVEWAREKSSTILDRLSTSDAYKKLSSASSSIKSAPKISAIADSSFHLLNPANQNLILALAELNLTRSKGEEQLLTGLGDTCYKYAVQACECIESEVSSLLHMEKSQRQRVNDALPGCTEKIFGSRIAVLRERAMKAKLPRHVSSDSSLDAIREAISYSVGVLKCKPLPKVVLAVNPIETSNIERRIQKHLNNTALEKTIAEETNPVLLSEKLRQLNLVNEEIDKTLAIKDTQIFDVKEIPTPSDICAGLLDIRSECSILYAETLMLKEKLEVSCKKDFADELTGTHEKSLECLSKSASQLKDLNDTVDKNKELLETRIDSLQQHILSELEKTKEKSEKYNIGVCQRAIFKGVSQTRDYAESNAQFVHRKHVAELLEKLFISVRSIIE